jgi:hypothetical protein
VDEEPDRPMVPLGVAPGNQWQVSATHASLVRSPQLPCPITVDAGNQIVTFDLARTAMIIIDMQNDFCHPQGWLARIGVDVAAARRPIEPLGRLLPRAAACSGTSHLAQLGQPPGPAQSQSRAPARL